MQSSAICRSITQILFITAALATATVAFAKDNPLDILITHIHATKAMSELSNADLAGKVMRDQYVTKHNGITHLYLRQRLGGIKVYNGDNDLARLIYVDVFTHLLGADGLPRSELFAPDRLWQSIIAPHLQEQSPATPVPVGTGNDILWGAMWETATYPDQKTNLPAEAQRQLAAYRRYVEQRNPLQPGDDPILKATAIWRGRSKQPGYVEYAEQVAMRGQAALAKGYRSEKLTRDDESALRDYAIYVGIQQTGAKILPFHLGVSRSEPFKPGESAPDFKLLRLESVLASMTYSDVFEPDLLYYLKPDAADRLRLLWQKPEPVTNGVQLSAFRGKKPVVLILADPVDSFFPRCLAILEPMHRAYKDRVEFFIVHVTIHDTRMNAPEFFGKQAGNRVTHLHPQTLEQRARTAKLLYMRYPNATVPMLLDDMQQTTRNAYMAEGGDARMILVDVDGKIAHDGAGWNTWEKGPYRDDVLWANELESELRTLLANDGKSDPDRKELRGRRKTPFASTRAAFKDRVVSSYRSKMLNTGFLCGTITKVNTTTVQVSPGLAEGFGYRFIQEAGDRAKLDDATRQQLQQVEAWRAGKTYTFAVDNKVELFLNGRECEPTDLKHGDVVGVKYDPAAEQQPIIRPEQLRASRRCE